MTNYRDELIQTIKDMGQELIDRAESMVHEDCDMITNFNINIDIPQPIDGHPELTWSTSVINKTFYDRMGRTAGDMKLEVHAETTTVEKKEPKYPIYIKHDTVHRTILVEFRSRKDAEECLEALNDLCNVYGSCDLGDLYNLCAIPIGDDPLGGENYTHGWTSMKGVEVCELPDSLDTVYAMVLPKPMPL